VRCRNILTRPGFVLEAQTFTWRVKAKHCRQRRTCALIAIFEGVQQMNQYSTLWVTYRATSEWLKHDKGLFPSAGGSDRDAEPERLVALAERVEEHVSPERSDWCTEARRAAMSQRPEGAK
jgi:hypothetical protein